MTYVVVGIICFLSGALVGLVLMGLMTASKVNSLYEEMDDMKRKHIIRVVNKTL